MPNLFVGRNHSKVSSLQPSMDPDVQDPENKHTIAEFRRMGKDGIAKFLNGDSRYAYCCTGTCFLKFLELGLLIASMSLFRFGAKAVLMEADKAFFVMGTTLAATVTTSCLLLTYVLGRSWKVQHTHLEVLLSFLMFAMTLSSGHVALDTYNTSNAKKLQPDVNFGFSAGICIVLVSLVYLADARLAIITFFKGKLQRITSGVETELPYIDIQYFTNFSCYLKIIQVSMAITALALFRFGALAQLLDGDRAFLFVGALTTSIAITTCLFISNLLGGSRLFIRTHMEIVLNLVLFGLLLPAGCVAIIYYTPSNLEMLNKDKAWHQVTNLGLGSGISALIGALAYLLDMALSLNQYFANKALDTSN